MILVVDRQYRYVIVNRAYLNFRGVTAEQVLGLTTEEVVGREAFEGSSRNRWTSASPAKSCTMK